MAPSPSRPARVLIVAGSDSGGGAGIQGDLKTVTCLGGYAATAITALTAQNTLGVFGIHEVPPAFITQQIQLVRDDIGVDAVKTGMLHSAEVIRAVVDAIAGLPNIVIDPVMVAKGGAALLQEEAVGALKALLLPLAHVVTPNIPEAERLSGLRIHTPNDMHAAAEAILALGPQAVLVKGGHLTGDTITNLLVSRAGVETFRTPRVPSASTHGTGCTLASAIATGLAQGMGLPEAVIHAQHYVAEAIGHAPGLGRGHGPLRHNWPLLSGVR